MISYFKKFKASISDFMYRNNIIYRYYYDNKSDNHIFMNYYSKENSCNETTNSVIILFNGKIPLNKTNLHGGLADRLKGIMSVYKTCKEMKLNFKIYHDNPYNLYTYLEPNIYNWYITESEISYNINTVQPHILRYTRIKNEINYHKKRLRKLLKNKATHHIYTNINMIEDFEFAKLFHELFIPSKALNNNIEYNLQKIGNSYISLSFRFTHLLGDPIDIYMTELPDDQKQSLIKKAVNCIINIHATYPEHKLLINSDSAYFLNHINNLKLDYTYIIPGIPVHIDQEPNASEASYMKTFTDFFMISKADKVILVKSADMYKSEFPKFAALIGEKTFDIINI